MTGVEPPALDEAEVAALERAIRLARLGRGQVEPNPLVGCVLLRDGEVVGEGFHARVGGPHAEPEAIRNALERQQNPAGTTACVTLEPCCHTSKRTPPCVPTLIRAGVRRVVFGTIDPNPAVRGEGVRQLKAAGVGVVEAPPAAGLKCRQLIAPFVARTVRGRPFVTVKWAEDVDGHIAGPGGERRQISGELATEVVHQFRALLGRFGAILVGGATVRQDDPLLTARPQQPRRPSGSGGAHLPPDDPAPVVLADVPQPRRVVFTRSGRVPGSARLLASPGGPSQVMVIGPELSLREAMAALLAEGVAEVLVESGGRLAAELAAEGLVDRYWVLRSRRVRLGPGSLPASAWNLPDAIVMGQTLDLGDDVLVEAWDQRSGTFADGGASPDLEWAARLAAKQGPAG